jgi:hypothetical protein
MPNCYEPANKLLPKLRQSTFWPCRLLPLGVAVPASGSPKPLIQNNKELAQKALKQLCQTFWLQTYLTFCFYEVKTPQLQLRMVCGK